MEKILIIDFGSQYTQLIARRVRELNVFSEIVPFHKAESLVLDANVKGVILSGSPASVRQENPPKIDLSLLSSVPVLAVCYGAQLIAHEFGGLVEASTVREYGQAKLLHVQDSPLFQNVPNDTTVWMSHGDSILQIPNDYHIIARTDRIPVAAFKHQSLPVYGLQFHPEVTHTVYGKTILENFVINICQVKPEWYPLAFIEQTHETVKQTVGSEQVICALSGGVDSSVVATLLNLSIHDRLHCIFINNGLLRKNEAEQVLQSYQKIGLNVHYVDASERFWTALKDIEDPETKRKTIGRVFIEVFEAEAKRIKEVGFLAQGTIYPDVIESSGLNGTAQVIKSHHNVGGLPERMHLKVLEPLKFLFKDEVRQVGATLNMPVEILQRHPFPGPGLAIRILGAVNEERVKLLQACDAIYIDALKEFGLYDEVWQAFAVLLPINSVGVMGDERTYENVLALRAVTSIDGMTADWARLPHDFLAEVSNRIINGVKGVNRVVYDISSKPPATIEWE